MDNSTRLSFTLRDEYQIISINRHRFERKTTNNVNFLIVFSQRIELNNLQTPAESVIFLFETLFSGAIIHYLCGNDEIHVFD